MVIQHEHQHDETLLATLQLMLERCPALPDLGRPRSSQVPTAEEVFVPGPEDRTEVSILRVLVTVRFPDSAKIVRLETLHTDFGPMEDF